LRRKSKRISSVLSMFMNLAVTILPCDLRRCAPIDLRLPDGRSSVSNS
jgi:hypothetical protein